MDHVSPFAAKWDCSKVGNWWRRVCCWWCSCFLRVIFSSGLKHSSNLSSMTSRFHLPSIICDHLLILSLGLPCRALYVPHSNPGLGRFKKLGRVYFFEVFESMQLSFECCKYRYKTCSWPLRSKITALKVSYIKPISEGVQLNLSKEITAPTFSY